jgi:hypothetical protein
LVGVVLCEARSARKGKTMNAEEIPEHELERPAEMAMGPRIDRLKRLLEHMEAAPVVRGNRRFDFGVFRSECGTAGCMAGELPAIWPEEWKFVEGIIGFVPELKHPLSSNWTGDHIGEFFGIEFETARRIFYPSAFNELHGDSTREEVVANLQGVIAELVEVERIRRGKVVEA